MKKLVIIAGLVMLITSVGLYGIVSADDTKSSSEASVSTSGGKFDGRWTGEFESGFMGKLPMGFDFKSNGNELTGTADVQQGKVDIEDGKIEGKNISFHYTTDIMGMSMTLKYKGELLSENKLKVSWEAEMSGGGSAVVPVEAEVLVEAVLLLKLNVLLHVNDCN
jgi:hypothetical protein